MWRASFKREEFGQPVIDIAHASSQIEFMLQLEDLFAQLGNAGVIQLDAETCRHHIVKGIGAFGDIEHRKSHEHAHAGTVDNRRTDLQVAGQFDLPFLAQGIDETTAFENIGGNAVTGGVIRPMVEVA